MSFSEKSLVHVMFSQKLPNYRKIYICFTPFTPSIQRNFSVNSSRKFFEGTHARTSCLLTNRFEVKSALPYDFRLNSQTKSSHYQVKPRHGPNKYGKYIQFEYKQKLKWYVAIEFVDNLATTHNA